MSAGGKVWLEAARPKTLPAAVIPVVVATALAAAQGRADYGEAAICLTFALLVQIGTNFANDYFDFVKGADTAERVGPRRAVAAGLNATGCHVRDLRVAFDEFEDDDNREVLVSYLRSHGVAVPDDFLANDHNPTELSIEYMERAVTVADERRSTDTPDA